MNKRQLKKAVKKYEKHIQNEVYNLLANPKKLKVNSPAYIMPPQTITINLEVDKLDLLPQLDKA